MRPEMKSVLLDASTNILLAAGTSPFAIEIVNTFTDDTQCAHYVAVPQPWPLSFRHHDRYVRWTWEYPSRTFSRTKSGLINEALRVRSALASAKVDALSTVMLRLNQVRYKVGTGLSFQETVYLTKRSQAVEFRKSGYDESRLRDFPYVLQYADFAGSSYKQAADDIVLKAQITEDTLAKTELLRLKYFNKIREAKSSDELVELLRSLHLDCYGILI
jgi:hypothetical protein